jgi:HD-GYP domain-containing protein (c-di-GMP phosphodiesterase class II)
MSIDAVPDAPGMSTRQRIACLVAWRLMVRYDPALGAHSEVVGRAALRLASPARAAEWYWAGRLHDFGKLGLPRVFWNTPRLFTDRERAQARIHPVVGARVLHWLGAPPAIIEGAYYHHERWNGTGYPHDIGQHTIPLIGRALAIADVWGAITQDRPYRAAMPDPTARAFLERYAGSLFDPTLVARFLASPEPSDGNFYTRV